MLLIAGIVAAVRGNWHSSVGAAAVSCLVELMMMLCFINCLLSAYQVESMLNSLNLDLAEQT